MTSHLRLKELKVRTTTVISDSLTYNWRAPEDGGRVTEWKPRTLSGLTEKPAPTETPAAPSEAA